MGTRVRHKQGQVNRSWLALRVTKSSLPRVGAAVACLALCRFLFLLLPLLLFAGCVDSIALAVVCVRWALPLLLAFLLNKSYHSCCHLCSAKPAGCCFCCGVAREAAEYTASAKMDVWCTHFTALLHCCTQTDSIASFAFRCQML